MVLGNLDAFTQFYDCGWKRGFDEKIWDIAGIFERFRFIWMVEK
jgi:hypothetical protein